MNLLLFLFLMLISLALVFGAFRHSLQALYVVLGVLYVITNITAGKIAVLDFYLFTVPASCAAPLYASLFLATDIIAETVSRRAAFLAVWFAFTGQVAFVVLGFLIRAIVPVPDSAIAGALDVMFGFVPRLILGSVIAYMVSQHFDIWFFHALKKRHGPRLLWLRNNLSTLLSQLIDSFIVFSIAFMGVIDDWIIVMFSTYIIKVVVALCDTPWIYLARALGTRGTSHGEGRD